MHKRTAHRWRIIALIVAGVFGALGSFWLLQVMLYDGLGIRPGAPGNEPDYIVEKFSFVRAAKTGQARYIVSGARLTHRPLGDVSDVERPVMQSLSSERAPMLVRSERARIEHLSNTVHLSGNVNLDRAAKGESQALKLKTQALTVLADEDRMETDQPVEMTLGASVVTSTGMKANNATGQVQLLNRVHITYPPVAR
jgi:lipopolysaccharide export system protein LptC